MELPGIGEFTSPVPTFLGQPGYVYVFQENSGGPYKIGFTKEEGANRRLINVQVGNPREIHKRAVVAVSTSTVEWVIHKMLTDHRAKKGEWFLPTPITTKFTQEIEVVCKTIERKLERIRCELTDQQ